MTLDTFWYCLWNWNGYYNISIRQPIAFFTILLSFCLFEIFILTWINICICSSVNIRFKHIKSPLIRPFSVTMGNWEQLLERHWSWCKQLKGKHPEICVSSTVYPLSHNPPFSNWVPRHTTKLYIHMSAMFFTPIWISFY